MKKLNFKQLVEKLILTEDGDDELNGALSNVTDNETQSIDTSSNNELDSISLSTKDPKKQDWCSLMEAAADQDWGKDKWLDLKAANEANGKTKPIIQNLQPETATAYDVFKIFANLTVDKAILNKFIAIGADFIEDAYELGVDRVVGLSDNNPIIKNAKQILTNKCELDKNTYGARNKKQGVADFIRITTKDPNNVLFKPDLYIKDPKDIFKYLGFQSKLLKGDLAEQWNSLHKDKDAVKCIMYDGGTATKEEATESAAITKLKPLSEIQTTMAECFDLNITDKMDRTATANDIEELANKLTSQYSKEAINTALHNIYVSTAGSKDSAWNKAWPMKDIPADVTPKIVEILESQDINFKGAIIKIATKINSDETEEKKQ